MKSRSLKTRTWKPPRRPLQQAVHYLDGRRRCNSIPLPGYGAPRSLVTREIAKMGQATNRFRAHTEGLIPSPPTSG